MPLPYKAFQIGYTKINWHSFFQIFLAQKSWKRVTLSRGI